VIYHRWISLKWVPKLVPKDNMGMLPGKWLTPFSQHGRESISLDVTRFRVCLEEIL